MIRFQNDTVAEFFGQRSPDGWQVVPAKRFCREIDQRSSTGEEELLGLSKATGVRRKSDMDQRASEAEDYAGYKRVTKGDLISNKMQAWNGMFGISPYDGITSPDYAIYRLKNTVNHRFIEYVCRTDLYAKEFHAKSRGMGTGFLRLNQSEFLSTPFILPDLATQRRIADFLDRETARIDLLIEKKQRLVALLGKKWESVVENVISTGGKRTKLGHHIDILSGYAFPSSDFSTDPEDIPLLRGANVSPGSIRWDDTVYWSRDRLSKVTCFLLDAGDVVLGMDRPWISSGIRVAELTEQDTPALLLQRVCRIAPRMTLDKQFMKLLLTSRQFLAYFEPIMTGVSVPHISPDQVSSFRFEYIERDEQVRRAIEAGRERDRIIRVQQSTEKSIDRLKEYRSALITAAVTGQIDVSTYARSGTTDRHLDAIQEETGS